MNRGFPGGQLPPGASATRRSGDQRASTKLRQTVMLAVFILLAALQVTPAAEQRVPASLSGTWKGVYFIYPNLMALELALSSSGDGVVSGVLKYSAAVDIRSALGQPKQGSFQVAGHYDEASRSFRLEPGAWIEKPPMAGATGPLAGVVDPKAVQMAGVFEFPNLPVAVLFVLARDAGGDTLIAGIKQSGYPPPPSRAQQEQALDERRREAMESTFERMRAMNQPGVEEQIAKMRQQMVAGDQQQLEMQERALEQLKKMPRQPALDEQIKQIEEAVAAKKNQLKAANNPGAAAASNAWSPPSADRLAAWASRVKTELPKLDLLGTPMQIIYAPSLNLFGDEYFREYFGTTYQAMDTVQRKSVATVFTQNAVKFQEFAYLARPFQNVGDFGAPDVTVSIYWQRVLRAWLGELLSYFAAMSPELNSFDHLNSAEATGKSELPLLWPSEREKFTGALTDTRRRLANPVLTLKADRLFASASGLGGARDLAAWSTREGDILKYAPSAGQQTFQQRIDTRLDQTLQPLVDAELGALGKFGSGLDAIVAGNRWYGSFSNTYAFAVRRPPVQTALQKFQVARAKDLLAAQPALIAQVDAAGQEAQVRAVLTQYLTCPGDDASSVATAVRQRADKRIAAIQHEEMMGMFSAYEKGLMTPPESGHLDLARADPKHIPQPDELRLALLRGMAFGTGRMLSPHSAKISTLFGGGSMIVTISDTRKGRYVQTETGTWMVLYVIDMRFSLPSHDPLWDADPNLRKGAQMSCDAVNTMAALLGEEDNIQEFKLYPDGWGVPSMREEGAGRAGLEALLKSMIKQK